MTFKKYSTLENHTNSKFLQHAFDMIADKPDTPFVAREKIHGTNFSVIITKDSIVPAKRTGPILDTEKFFGYEDLMKKYKSAFENIQEYYSPFFDEEINSIQIFGEYAGGGIQKEVDYGEKDFYVFDLTVAGMYQSDDVVCNFCEKYGLKVAPLIKHGTLEELLKLPVEYESVVNDYDKAFSLVGVGASVVEYVQREPKDNVSEGLVIKPVVPMFMHNGSRLAIKYKTDAFKEKGKGKTPKIPTPLPEADLELLNEFSKYAEPARIGNVCSHIGEITAKDFGKVLGLTMRDIFIEAEREGITIDQAEQPSKLKGELTKIVSAEIRKIWIDLISN